MTKTSTVHQTALLLQTMCARIERARIAWIVACTSDAERPERREARERLVRAERELVESIASLWCSS